MAAVRGGKKLAREDLDRLFEEFYPRLFNYMYYRTLNRTVSDDLTSDTMVNVVRAYDTFDPAKGNVEAWIFRIARNTLFSYYRRQKETVDIDGVPQQYVAEEDDYGDLDDEGARVRALLAQLDEQDRELVYLKYWEELSNKEIGERLAMNASTVSTKLWRAMKKLRSLMGEN